MTDDPINLEPLNETARAFSLQLSTMLVLLDQTCDDDEDTEAFRSLLYLMDYTATRRGPGWLNQLEGPFDWGISAGIDLVHSKFCEGKLQGLS